MIVGTQKETMCFLELSVLPERFLAIQDLESPEDEPKQQGGDSFTDKRLRALAPLTGLEPKL